MNAPPVDWTLDRARALDAEDPIGAIRQRFVMPPGVIYLNGNSLGPLVAGVSERVLHTIREEWGTHLSRSWSELGWMESPLVTGDRIGRLIGATAGEVLVADTTSVALAKLVGAALRARPGRRTVLSSSDNFPSDLYSAMSAAQLAGANLRVVDAGEVEAALDSDVAVCCLTQVDFRTGALHDLPRITQAAHDAGALMLWDLCHSAGAVPVGCEQHGVDLAVGCTYKYLSGGPGSPSFLYVRRGLQDELDNPIPGWLGHDAPFEFSLAWRPAKGVRRFLTSTPPIVALAALHAALDAFEGVSIDEIREKSMALGQMFVDVVAGAAVDGLRVASPFSAAARGSQVSLAHPAAAQLAAALGSRGVICDVRPPDVCRFGMSALCLSYESVLIAAESVVDVARGLAGGR